jgi:hypothetical protein
MTVTKTIRAFRRTSALYTALLIGLTACGSDSTGPGPVDSSAALQSLAVGLSDFSTEGTFVPSAGSLSDLAPLLGQGRITIDGNEQRMFALGLRETFPAGTCAETLFPLPGIPPEPGVCTQPPNQILLLFWQTRSARSRPDKLFIVAADAGTTNFGFDLVGDNGETTALAFGGAIYTAGPDDFWISTGGSLTSSVSPTSQTCTFPPPPFANSATCNIAAFDEEGTIGLESFSLESTATKTMSISIPRQTVYGILQAITEVKPITLGPRAQRALPTLSR